MRAVPRLASVSRFALPHIRRAERRRALSDSTANLASTTMSSSINASTSPAPVLKPVLRAIGCLVVARSRTSNWRPARLAQPGGDERRLVGTAVVGNDDLVSISGSLCSQGCDDFWQQMATVERRHDHRDIWLRSRHEDSFDLSVPDQRQRHRRTRSTSLGRTRECSRAALSTDPSSKRLRCGGGPRGRAFGRALGQTAAPRRHHPSRRRLLRSPTGQSPHPPQRQRSPHGALTRPERPRRRLR